MSQSAMIIRFINLDRTPNRCREFLAVNKHLSHVSRFAAIDGNDLDPDALVRDGIISVGIPQIYTRGNLGLALSHFALWREAIESGNTVTICEDDAIFNRDFLHAADKVISRLPTDWDLVLWGWNFDASLMMDLLPGVSPCLVHCDVEQMRIGSCSSKDSCCRHNLSGSARPSVHLAILYQQKGRVLFKVCAIRSRS